MEKFKKELKEIWEHEGARCLILSILGMFFTVLASEIITYDKVLIKDYTFVVCIVLFLLAFCFNYIFKTSRLGFLIVYIYIMILSIIDYFVYRSNTNHFTVSNLLSFKTAQTVFTKEYLQVDARFFVAIIFYIISLIFIIKSKSTKKTIRNRKMTLVCISLLVLFFSSIIFTNFLSRMCITKGLNFSHKQVESATYIVYFHSGINDFITSHASKDDIEISEQILSSYKKEENIIDKQPNIVIIMCEALTDYYIYKDFKTTESYMPYIQSLQDNYTSGYIYPPYTGGGTCDSEFEFLTGMSVENVALQAMSYNKYLNQPERTFPSMVSNFKNQGYYTIAMHPGEDISYNRNVVYKALQFDEIYFNESIDSSSDKNLFDFIDKNLNEHDEPLFQFAVTIFNHAPYQADGTEYKYLDIKCDNDFEGKMNRYLTNVRETDKYLKEFVEKINEPTIIVIFGDHQPILSMEKECDFIDEENETKVPYIIWSNCDYDFSDMPKELSGNYFASYFFKSLNYPLSNFYQFQLDISKDNKNIREENVEKNKEYMSIQKYYLFYKNMNKSYFE